MPEHTESENTRTEIFAAETRRCEALVKADQALLGELLHDDLIHVHTSGAADSKTDFLEALGTRRIFVSVQRLSYKVRPLGHVAVASGDVRQRLRNPVTGEKKDMLIATTQVWLQDSGRWQMLHFQATSHRTA